MKKSSLRTVTRFALFIPALLLLAAGIQAQGPGYLKPPKDVLDVLHAPVTPSVSLSPTRDRMMLVESTRFPSIAELAAPMLRLAGLRINPNTNGPHRPPRIVAMTLKNIADGKETKVALPANANPGSPNWSHNGKIFAFTNTTATGIELWLGDAQTGATRQVRGIKLNAAYGSAFEWLPDGVTLLCQTIVAGRGNPPAPPKAPTGPTIQESAGRPAPVRTFQDLLQNAHDENLFDYYATSQLEFVNTSDLKRTPIGKPAIYASTQASPDGKYLLVVRNQKPYSYLLTAGSFPREVEVWDMSGKVVYKVASQPLADQIPIDGVQTGPRSYSWIPVEPATLAWAEALDGGDPKKKVPHRDRILLFAAPFQGSPAEFTKTEHRFAGLTWFDSDGIVLVRDTDRDRRWNRVFLLNYRNPAQAARLIWDRSMQDRYNDPGTPITRLLPTGNRAVLKNGNFIYLQGQGASPKGDHPFLDRFDITTLKSERLFQCADGSYESVVGLLADDATRFITRHETATEPPNYFLRAADGSRKALTAFKDPAPQLRGITKELVTYKRGDGVQLSFTLYLPPAYKRGQPLPTLVWAYPQEFSDPDTAGQVSGSPSRFTMIGGTSHLFALLLGYAVLDGATMPVVGDAQTMNDTYVEQIVASAKAAIDKAAEMGVTDPTRVGVGGHSYGAFMTANLLAHCDLFRAGIARSGAYNRTLTPFGFQNERRTFWEAPEMYFKVSPFMFAHKINEPILLIHGEADNNSGTFPIQSERMYQAIRGNGGTVRYVTLPFESHGYAAEESVEHTLAEMLNWLEKHVKPATR